MHAFRFSNVNAVLNDIFGYFWRNLITNVSLLKFNKNLIIDVLTYYPFDSYFSCNLTTVKVVNSYSDHWLKPVEEVFPRKIVNLQGCPLIAAVWNTPPYFSYEETENGVYKIDYFEADLLGALAEKLNFSLILIEPPNDEQRGKVLENGTITGAMKMVRSN